MDTKAIIERVISIVNRQHVGFGGSRDGLGFLGQPQTLRTEANTAIKAWIEQDDSAPMLSFVQLLQLTNTIDTNEADTLLDAIEAASTRRT